MKVRQVLSRETKVSALKAILNSKVDRSGMLWLLIYHPGRGAWSNSTKFQLKQLSKYRPNNEEFTIDSILPWAMPSGLWHHFNVKSARHRSDNPGPSGVKTKAVNAYQVTQSRKINLHENNYS